MAHASSRCAPGTQAVREGPVRAAACVEQQELWCSRLERRPAETRRSCQNGTYASERPKVRAIARATWPWSGSICGEGGGRAKGRAVSLGKQWEDYNRLVSTAPPTSSGTNVVVEVQHCYEQWL